MIKVSMGGVIGRILRDTYRVVLLARWQPGELQTHTTSLGHMSFYHPSRHLKHNFISKMERQF
jgi:hypothetical protein